jgi:hypothetical protein
MSRERVGQGFTADLVATRVELHPWWKGRVHDQK